MSVHVMVDTETFGTLPGSALRSIGAVTFDPHGGEGFDEQLFYCNIDRASCEAAGLKIDPQTEAWWQQQPAEAQEALASDPWDLRYAAFHFEAWWLSQKATHLWCNGACFDEPILRVALAAVGRPVPWKFWNVRDTRTIWDVAGMEARNMPRASGAHNALNDARCQAERVTEAFVKIKGPPPIMRSSFRVNEWERDLRPGHVLFREEIPEDMVREGDSLPGAMGDPLGR